MTSIFIFPPFCSKPRPDEEGIETGPAVLSTTSSKRSKPRPDEEGIETQSHWDNKSVHILELLSSKPRPDEEGIETFFPNTTNQEPAYKVPNLDLMKKGLRRFVWVCIWKGIFYRFQT